MVTWWLELPFSDPIHQMSFNTTQHNQPCPKQSRTVYPDLPRVKFCLTCFSWETHPWKWLTPCNHIGPSKNNHQKNIHAELKYFLMVYLGNRTWSLKWAAANRTSWVVVFFFGGKKRRLYSTQSFHRGCTTYLDELNSWAFYGISFRPSKILVRAAQGAICNKVKNVKTWAENPPLLPITSSENTSNTWGLVYDDPFLLGQFGPIFRCKLLMVQKSQGQPLGMVYKTL